VKYIWKLDNPSGIAKSRQPQQHCNVFVNLFGSPKTWNVLGDLGPPKTFQPNFGFGSVTNKNFDENTPHQIKEYMSKRLPTGTKPTYDEHKKTQKKVL
jgi:hypothetical protein